MAKIVSTLDVPRLYSQKDDWFKNHTRKTFAFLELFAPAKYKTIWDQPDLK